MASERLATFLREVSNWSWEEFVRAEHDPKYTTNQAIIFALIRSCAMRQLQAIKISLRRLDGNLKTPIRIEMPKVYYLFPNARTNNPPSPPAPGLSPPPSAVTGELLLTTAPPPPPLAPETEHDLPSLSLRETLQEMSDYPRELPEAITDLALQTEQWVKKQAPEPDEMPRVKSVVAAHLLIMAQSRNIDALTEVFDQIDGKLVETLQILGEDIYITSYITEAPAGAVLNDNGVLQLEAVEAQDLWARKLGGKS